MIFECKDVSCGYRRKPVLEHISFSVRSGEVLCILGANGEGKTTLLRTLLKLIPVLGGRIEIDGEDIAPWSSRKTAGFIGYVPQSTNPPFSYTVRNMILMGRTARIGGLANPDEHDMEITLRVIDRLGIAKLADKKFLNLSGGEKQLVIIARALAQEPQILIMDEPTNALDFANQQMVLRQVNDLRENRLAVIMTSHFPDHAFYCADRVLMVKDGGIFRQGLCQEVITEQNLEHLYGIPTRIVPTGIRSCRRREELKVCVALEEARTDGR